MSDSDDIARRDREFEELLRDGRITPSGFPTAALADIGLPMRCAASRIDGSPCSWPPIDGTGYCTVHVERSHHERKSRIAEIELGTTLWLRDAARDQPSTLA